MLAVLGSVVIDADQLARDVVEPGTPAYDDIVRGFGAAILQADGTLDRKALGAIVFADPEKLTQLESITHPRIRERFQGRLAELAAAGFAGIVVFDAPVLIESGNDRRMDRLIVVVADERTQLERQRQRDGASTEEAQRRLRSQLSLSEKAKRANYVIDNSGGDLEATRARVGEVYRALLADLDARQR